MYDETMHPLVLNQLQMENDLRRALEKDEFRLHYQPIVNTSSGRIVACEALLRWQHPERGLLPPSEFLSVAEDTGLIIPIGEWVLRTGCLQASEWMRDHDAETSPAVSINLFSRQFTRTELVVYVGEILAEIQLPANRLQLEITESATIDVPELAIDVMRRLRDLGVKVHLDDFGTGYSSLAYLQRFAIDTLKIDQGFTQRLGSSGAGGIEIVETIIASPATSVWTPSPRVSRPENSSKSSATSAASMARDSCSPSRGRRRRSWRSSSAVRWMWGQG